ncbi:MAG TPA: trehalase family glycosidase [Bacteroidales bacterium]|nr:trehalase family glycosidase [Bacteroidales bacterium]
MRNHLFLLLALTGITCLTSCQPATPKKDTKPSQYAEQYVQVSTYILENWHSSKVDSTSWKMPGSINLPKPYFSIAPNRNVQFYWDSYFTNAGLLLVDSLQEFAVNATDNLLYEVDTLGYVPNASEPWALNRSQTPFLSMMVRDVYEKTPSKDKDWLKRAYFTLKKEYTFWTDTSSHAIEDHTTTVAGLQRFYHHADEKELLAFYDQMKGRFSFPENLSREEKLEIASNWLPEAETMDFTPRYDHHCPNFASVDLNANLYMYEKNFAWMIKETGIAKSGEPDWENLARQRKNLINRYLWNDDRGLYMDYDFVHHRFAGLPCVVTLYPLWAGLASKEQARKVVKNLPLLEFDYGVTICAKAEHEHTYQWDYPAGWPPMYYLSVRALDNYGYKKEAGQIAQDYLDILTKNFLHPEPAFAVEKSSHDTTWREPGKIYEKYNVTDGKILDNEYISRPFLGWTSGVFIYLRNYMEKSR